MVAATVIAATTALHAKDSEKASSKTDPDSMDGMAMDGMDSETVQTKGWMTSFSKAMAEAESRGVPLIVHFEATWCVACRQMDSAVLTQPDVVEVLGESVIGVRIDADRDRELISRFKVDLLPTEIVLDSSGKETARHVGNVSLASYISRLNSLRGTPTSDSAVADSQAADKNNAEDDAEIRSCLITHFDGKMVGVGGYSPVALIRQRQWKKGSEEFVATYQGVDYFFQSDDERRTFTAEPSRFVPQLHGVDLVALYQDHRAAAGAIEYGSFYNGQLYFFASLQNRNRFQSNPSWYVKAIETRQAVNSEDFPFLRESETKGL
ncbi:MAG: thioredoxin family protein [Planctomycetaceae bacterium]|nr:thioredoxin family protein [Planctomycetaceae bacterium]